MFAGNAGDREKALGLTVSSVCDRKINSVADIQIGQSFLALAFYHHHHHHHFRVFALSA